jgi:hypothetical protein
MPKKKKDTRHENAIIEPTETHEIDTSVFDYIYNNKTTTGAEFKVKPYLSPADQLTFVKQIVENVFTDSGYTPALFDFARCYALIAVYTDIAFPNTEDISDKLCEIIYTTDILKCILSDINLTQYNTLISAAEKQIENRNRLIASYSAADDMYASATSILDKINAWLDKNLKNLKLSKNTLAQLSEIVSKFSSVSQADIAQEIVTVAQKDNVVEFPSDGK